MKQIVENSKAGDVWVQRLPAKKTKFTEWLKYAIVLFFIKITQIKIFGIFSFWKDHHVMIYFDPCRIFSVELPFPRWKTAEECIDQGVSIYRWNNIRELKESDVAILREACDKIIAAKNKYDLGQLIDIQLSVISGFPFKKESDLFDQGEENFVCSVSVASVFSYLRHELWNRNREDLPQLFSKLNEKRWNRKFVKAFNQQGYWDIDRTFPANFTNTDTHFNNEFKRIGIFDKKGKKIN